MKSKQEIIWLFARPLTEAGKAKWEAKGGEVRAVQRKRDGVTIYYRVLKEGTKVHARYQRQLDKLKKMREMRKKLEAEGVGPVPPRKGRKKKVVGKKPEAKKTGVKKGAIEEKIFSSIGEKQHTIEGLYAKAGGKMSIEAFHAKLLAMEKLGLIEMSASGDRSQSREYNIRSQRGLLNEVHSPRKEATHLSVLRAIQGPIKHSNILDLDAAFAACKELGISRSEFNDSIRKLSGGFRFEEAFGEDDPGIEIGGRKVNFITGNFHKPLADLAPKPASAESPANATQGNIYRSLQAKIDTGGAVQTVDALRKEHGKEMTRTQFCIELMDMEKRGLLQLRSNPAKNKGIKTKRGVLSEITPPEHQKVKIVQDAIAPLVKKKVVPVKDVYDAVAKKVGLTWNEYKYLVGEKISARKELASSMSNPDGVFADGLYWGYFT